MGGFLACDAPRAVYGGIVDSYADYVPSDDRRPAPPPPSFDRIPTDGTDWCGVDERLYDGPVWSPSVCTSDRDVPAASASAAEIALLERHSFAWPREIDGWTLRAVRHEVVLDEADG